MYYQHVKIRNSECLKTANGNIISSVYLTCEENSKVLCCVRTMSESEVLCCVKTMSEKSEVLCCVKTVSEKSKVLCCVKIVSEKSEVLCYISPRSLH